MRRLSMATAFFLAFSSLSTAQSAIATPPPPIQIPIFMIPVVVSVPGRDGSFFRTAVQAYNGGLNPIEGTFIFRPEGPDFIIGSSVLRFGVNPGQTIFFADLLAAMGLSGVGSVDVTAFTPTAPLVLSVRVFNDHGAAGKAGFTENVKRLDDFLGPAANVVLVAPYDVNAFRFNIGVRTFTTTMIDVTLRDQAGNLRKTLSLTFPPDFFQQVDAGTFLGGLPLNANDTITVFVRAGALILYGVTADNRTNDPAWQEPQRIPPTAVGPSSPTF